MNMQIRGEKKVMSNKCRNESGFTARQAQVFEFLSGYISMNGVPPTYLEISNEFGFSMTRVVQHLECLEDLGAIHRVRGIRAIRIGRRAA